MTAEVATKVRRGQPERLLPPAFEIVSNDPSLGPVDDTEKFDDPATVTEYGAEIVDEVAVLTMVTGKRQVNSTLKERQEAARFMIEKLHLDPQEVATRLGTLVVKLPEVIEPLGYEVLPRTDPAGKRVRPTARFQKIGTGKARGKVGGRA